MTTAGSSTPQRGPTITEHELARILSGWREVAGTALAFVRRFT